MTTPFTPRMIAAGVLAVGALVTTGGLAAAGALPGLDTSAGGAALVSHQPGTRTVTLEPGVADLKKAAYSASYDEQICSDPWLADFSQCATQLQRCAQQFANSTVPVLAVFNTAGTLYDCKPSS